MIMNVPTQEEINRINDKVDTVKVYVSEDGKLHFVDGDGADTELPFKSSLFTFFDATNVPIARSDSFKFSTDNSGGYFYVDISNLNGDHLWIEKWAGNGTTLKFFTITGNITSRGGFELQELATQSVGTSGSLVASDEILEQCNYNILVAYCYLFGSYTYLRRIES